MNPYTSTNNSKSKKDNPSEDAIQFTTPKSHRANLRSVFEILFPYG